MAGESLHRRVTHKFSIPLSPAILFIIKLFNSTSFIHLFCSHRNFFSLYRTVFISFFFINFFGPSPSEGARPVCTIVYARVPPYRNASDTHTQLIQTRQVRPASHRGKIKKADTHHNATVKEGGRHWGVISRGIVETTGPFVTDGMYPLVYLFMGDVRREFIYPSFIVWYGCMPRFIISTFFFAGKMRITAVRREESILRGCY